MDPDWQNVDDVLTSNRVMLDTGHACDVRFVLGKDKVTQGAHKFMLVSRSPVFDAMLCGPLCGTEEADIVVPDIEPDAFVDLLRYIYCGSSEITADNVMPILYAAKKYAVNGLVAKCIAFVEHYLDSENACTVLEQAHFFDETDFHEKVLTVVLRKADEILETEDVEQLCEKCLAALISSDNLIAKELQVLNACKRWAESQCSKHGLAVTDSNCRIMLGNTLYEIRFPLLEPAYFVQHLSPSQLLTQEEKVDIMNRFIIPSQSCKYFKSVVRSKGRYHRFNRFKQRHEAAFNNRSGANAIIFETSQDIYLEGFTIYGTCRAGEHELQVKGHVTSPEDEILCVVEKSLLTTAQTDIYDVMLDAGVRLKRAAPYILSVDITGAHTFAGFGGRLTAFCNETIFRFSHTDKSLTGTTVGHGQLPGLIFSL